MPPGKYEWAGRQGGGDCSFKINEVNIQYDDGLWECQVTSSTFEAQDQLASKPARLVVRGIYYFFFIFNHSNYNSTELKGNILLLTFFSHLLFN